MKSSIKRMLTSVAVAAVAMVSVGAAQAGGDVDTYKPSIWQGAYVGVHAGGTFADMGGDDAASAQGLTVTYEDNGDAFLGGIHAGLNTQRGNIVYGIEGDLSFSGANAELSITDGIDTVSVKLEQTYLASLRGRIGYAMDKTLAYATAGIAWVGMEASISENGNTVDSADETFTGFVIGGGVEHMFTEKMSLRGEALYYNFDDDGLELDNTVVRAGLSYKFN